MEEHRCAISGRKWRQVLLDYSSTLDMGHLTAPSLGVKSSTTASSGTKTESGSNVGAISQPSAAFTGVLEENDYVVDSHTLADISKEESKDHFVGDIVWKNIVGFVVMHTCIIHSFYYLFTNGTAPRNIIILVIYSQLLNFGVAGGAHRLWAHKAYKVKPALKVFMLYLQTAAGQNSLYEWVRDHRVHHKFTETNADPHNIKRGFFFAHMGWLMRKKHPDVREKGKLIDMTDLEKDAVVMLQHRYYIPLVLITGFIIPILAFQAISGESWLIVISATITRYAIGLHLTWLVNSYAHRFGNKPYDKHVQATDSLFMGYVGHGEGFHNYHHVFPWDYRASEFLYYRGMNVTASMIDFCAKLGLAYDLKTVSTNVIKSRAIRTGDGSHHVWGWGDKDIPPEHIKMTVTLNKKCDNNKDI